MGQATSEQPKCLAVAAGKPLLEWQLAALDHAGVAPVAVVTGYQAALLASSSPSTSVIEEIVLF